MSGVRRGDSRASRRDGGGRSARLKRRLFNLAAAVSLVLFLVVLAAWVRSRFVGDIFYRSSFRQRDDGWTSWTQYRITISGGGVWISRSSQAWPEFGPEAGAAYGLAARIPFHETMGPANPSDIAPGWSSGGFGIRFGSGPRGFAVPVVAGPAATTLNLLFPLWAAALLTALLPALRLWRDHRGRRAREWQSEGRCPTCGYDLRATPDRCPECGATPANVKPERSQAGVEATA